MPHGRSVDAGTYVPRLERILLTNILPFWQAALDPERGGYLIGHDHLGRPRPAGSKGLVSQARQLWLFARLARSPYGRPEHMAAAHLGYRFLRDRLWDAEYGGFFWEVEAGTGQPLRAAKHLYGQAFALYALAEYYRAGQDESARVLAGVCMDLIAEHGYDHRHGGYRETLTRDWRPERDEARSYLGGPAGGKTMNTHLHLLEAYTAWQRVVPAPATRAALAELHGRLSGWLARGGGDLHAADWRAERASRISYGHHLEGIWLVLDASAALGAQPGALIGPLRARFAACLEAAYDFKLGGFFEYGPARGRASGRDKIWWVQAESLLACLHLWRATGTSFYLAMFGRLLAYLETHQIDWRHGEWHARVTGVGPAREDKSHLWKAGYHSGRAMIEGLALLKGGTDRGSG